MSLVQLEKLRGCIEEFNALFTTVHTGDEVLLGYTPNTGTCVTIDGADFNAALLDIWLGEEQPADESLKEAVLGQLRCAGGRYATKAPVRDTCKHAMFAGKARARPYIPNTACRLP